MTMMTYRHRITSIALLVAAAMPQGGMAFITPINPNHVLSSSLFASIGVFYGTSTGSTEESARLISEQFGDVASEPIDVDEIKGSLAAKLAEYDSLIVGTPTWNTGADTERSGRCSIYIILEALIYVTVTYNENHGHLPKLSGTGWDEIYYSEMKVGDSFISLAGIHSIIRYIQFCHSYHLTSVHQLSLLVLV
jgi:flavodoxin I